MSTTHYTIPATGIYEPQDLRNLLWHKCVRDRRSLANVAKLDYHNDLNKMIDEGLNANFMTRERWFDPATISDLMEETAGLEFLSTKLNVSAQQFEDLQLTAKEYELLGITFDDVNHHYGETLARRELKRLGHKTSDSYFLTHFDSDTLEEEGSSDTESEEETVVEWVL